MRTSGFYWAYWMLTRPVGWIIRLMLGLVRLSIGAVRSLFLFCLPAGGLHFRPVSNAERCLRLVVAAGFAVTATTVLAGTRLRSTVPVRPSDPGRILQHPGGWIVGAIVLLALYVFVEDFAWRDTLMAVIGLFVAAAQLYLTTGGGWILVAVALTLVMFVVLAVLASNVPVVGKLVILLALFLAYQVVTSAAAA